jgi:hypothetical protein
MTAFVFRWRLFRAACGLLVLTPVKGLPPGLDGDACAVQSLYGPLTHLHRAHRTHWVARSFLLAKPVEECILWLELEGDCEWG